MKNQLLFSTILVAQAAAVSTTFRASSRALSATRAASPDVATSNYVQVRRSTSSSSSRRKAYTKALLRGPGADGVYTTPAGVEALDDLFSEEYVGPISFGDQSFEVIFDTGSSDTWLVQSGFQCVDDEGNDQDEADCYFGPPFNGTFAYGEIPDINFNIEYGDGEFLTGVFGYEDVTIAGITVQKQQVALVNYAYWYGDNETSGLTGLAYPYLTSAYSGTNASEDTGADFVEYDPLFTTMVEQNLSAPYFSLALSRNSPDGYIAFGGLPPVEHEGDFASSPILLLDINEPYENISQYAFYTIIPDAYVLANVSTSAAGIPVIVDSGTTLLYLPTNIAEPVLNAYDPPAIYIDDEGAYFVPCNATAPEFGITIGGKTFTVSAEDLIYQDIIDTPSGLCLAGIVDGGTEGSFIFGDTFLNNVISVFDVGAAEMRFAARVPY
ncbi:aspartic peptidase domain-containing protein [Xylariales sp. PMI_506]|nr:aspartic peptidase domain-containing protein [Xylariales sp. PMI_506]